MNEDFFCCVILSCRTNRPMQHQAVSISYYHSLHRQRCSIIRSLQVAVLSSVHSRRRSQCKRLRAIIIRLSSWLPLPVTMAHQSSAIFRPIHRCNLTWQVQPRLDSKARSQTSFSQVIWHSCSFKHFADIKHLTVSQN